MKNQNIKQFAQPLVDEVVESLAASDWTNKYVYGNWLAQTYYYVCHSTRIIATTASRFHVNNDHLHSQLTHHLREEKNHERLAVADLKQLGLTKDFFGEYASTKAIYRNAYYLIEREHPISFYGYVFLLENLPVRIGKEMMQAANSSFGTKSTSFLKLHAEEDVDHLNSYSEFLEKLSNEEKVFAKEAILTTAQNYLRFMEDIRAFASKQKISRAA